jgi:hypothetical protein
VLEEIDLVLVMSVNPGFGGQKFIASQLKKIEAIANRIAKEGLDVEIEVDGGIDAETAPQAVERRRHRAGRRHRGLPRRPDLMPPTSRRSGRRMSARRFGRRARRRPQARARFLAVAADGARASR